MRVGGKGVKRQIPRVLVWHEHAWADGAMCLFSAYMIDKGMWRRGQLLGTGRRRVPREDGEGVARVPLQGCHCKDAAARVPCVEASEMGGRAMGGAGRRAGGTGRRLWVAGVDGRF